MFDVFCKKRDTAIGHAVSQLHNKLSRPILACIVAAPWDSMFVHWSISEMGGLPERVVPFWISSTNFELS